MTTRTALAAALLAAIATGATAAGAEIPRRPEQLVFPPLAFPVPDAGAMRVTLANGLPVYLVEDRSLPLVEVDVIFRGGQYLEPEGKEGLAQLTARVWRNGGAGDLDARRFDEAVDDLGAKLTTEIGPATGRVHLDLLARDAGRGLDLLRDLLLAPRFDPARLAAARAELLADLRSRNDDPADVEDREWSRLVYGERYWLNRLPTEGSLGAIRREDVAGFERRLADPSAMVAAVSGDFERAAMLARLDATLGSLPRGGVALPPVPQPTGTAPPGVYLVDVPGASQGRVSIGHLGARRPLADEFALKVAADIAGGPGFQAWMLSRIRSEEGLAYAAYADFTVGSLYPGDFRASFQSKSSTCARAALMTTELLAKLRTGAVTDAELRMSRNSFAAALLRLFETRFQAAARFAQDEIEGRDHAYWSGYADRMAAVTAPAVGAAAKAHIRPGEYIVLVVGDVAEILKGGADHPEARLDHLGPLTRVPPRDPRTLLPAAR
ncbi:MAG TPA: pitrilysin family protein [Thermoanaerobaculaceae bacterium]|nr:pitrilysin family protein [Thermoanaerobaculaceae bacterium]